MSRTHSLNLEDIVEASERIASYLNDLTYSEFETDQMRIDEVIRYHQIEGKIDF